jgi:hypothetical protein
MRLVLWIKLAEQPASAKGKDVLGFQARHEGAELPEVQQQKLATIEDVAAMAGVSIATVSRAIN